MIITGTGCRRRTFTAAAAPVPLAAAPPPLLAQPETAQHTATHPMRQKTAFIVIE